MAGTDLAQIADGLKQIIWQYRQQYNMLLPEGIDLETFVGAASAAMYKNPKVAQAAAQDPIALIVALRECARLGHLPGTEEYALAVRGGRVQGMEQYQGVVERMYRSGAVASVHADVVCIGENFQRRGNEPPIHEADWLNRDTATDKLAGVYAYAELTTGRYSRIVIMGKPEVMRHRAFAQTHNVWDGDFGVSMWLKTALRELRKWIPTSSEYRLAEARADAAAAALDRVPPQVRPLAVPEPRSAPDEGYGQDPMTVDGEAVEVGKDQQ
jgi:recombination protein RecT